MSAILKDINANRKVNLDLPELVADLSLLMLRRFFKRRALEVAARHLLPLAISDPSSSHFDRIRAAFDIDVEAELSETARRFRNYEECLFTSEFDDMIELVEDSPATLALSERIADLMCKRFEQTVASAIGAQAV
jgi:hypothetical protein